MTIVHLPDGLTERERNRLEALRHNPENGDYAEFIRMLQKQERLDRARSSYSRHALTAARH